MHTRPLLPALLLLTCALHQHAQTPQQQYEAFREQAMKEYSDFRSQANKSYAEFMLRVWKEYSQKPAIPKPAIKEKPPVIFQPDEEPRPDNDTVTIKDVVTPPAPRPRPTPVAPIKATPKQDIDNVDFTFYGTPCSVRYPAGAKISTGSNSNAELSRQWSYLSGPEFNVTISDCLALRQRLKLCDWAYLKMLDAIGKAICGDSDEARLLTAFLYCQSGYSMRLARADGHIFMLFASDYRLYDYSYFVVGGILYYNYGGPKDSRAEILDIGFPKEQTLALNITDEQLLAESNTTARQLKSLRYPSCDATVEVNKNLIDFYDGYPSSMTGNDFMTRWALYASTPLASNVAGQLYPQLKKAIDGKTQLEAANILLNWVQTAFVYEYDDKVWGHDRAFFAEETLYYPYCDCEDRSILFSRLVRDIIGLDVALVYYPGHIATAIGFTEPVAGVGLTIKGRQFIIADPTYINAPVGQQMPGLDSGNISAILLSRQS